MNLVFIGAGALGMLFAGKWAQVGTQPPLMVTRTYEQAEQMQSKGITISEEDNTAKDGGPAIQKQINAAVQAVCFEEACDSTEWKLRISQADWIFLMVKQHQINESLLRFIDEAMNNENSRDTRLICFQNGIGHADKLNQIVSANRIYAAVTTEGAHKIGVCDVAHKGKGVTTFGPAPLWSPARNEVYPQAYDKKNENKLQCALNEAGFDACLSNQMDRYIWNKLLMNSVINPLTAIHRIKNGQLLQSPFLARIMADLFCEGRVLAEAMQIAVSEDLWQQLFQVCRRTSNNTSSMLQDMMSGRQTEIEWINGSLIRMAQRLGMPLPCNEALYLHVKLLENNDDPHPATIQVDKL